ncbi:hypothetical protein ACFYVR_17955 [Rhodococcus sp. NPDC003318]|uniref:hypothetical protein n=1 Tax=Rhodococcus sp. NPDC003318 TaxID=3364503 RepID=UPI0036A44978
MTARVLSRTSLARASVTVAAAAALVGAPAVAHADEWPPVPDYPTPVVPFDTKDFLTPDNPEYWNPFVAKNRLTSPYGTSTRIVCTAFHGVLLECWQADLQGNPHKLVQLPVDFPNVSGSTMPGGGPGHFVYPIWSTGS